MERVVVIKAREYVGGAPMEAKEGVRDRQMIYLETGFPTRPLIMGIVEIDPGCKRPLHRHNCEEVYYLLQGNTGEETVRLVVVGGIMFVGLLPEWPTSSPYEIFEGESAR
jgi:hypothetical protein